jgi:hypothetical protein
MPNPGVDSLLYGEFKRKFSDQPEKAHAPNTRFCYASNEYLIKGPVDWINMHTKGQPLHLIGIIGGGDTALSYVANLWPERAFLFDASDKAAEYLGLRLSLIKEASNVSEYLLDMLCVRPEHRDTFFNVNGNAALRQRIREYEPDYVAIALQGGRFMNKNNIEHSAAANEVYVDPTFRKKAAVECVRYMEHCRDSGQKELSWIETQNYDALRKSAQEGRIKGFCADYFGGFKPTAQAVIQLYGIKNLVVYLSNVTDILERARTQDQHIDNCQRIKEVLDPLSDLVDRMWVIDSKVDGTNRIVYGK